MGKQKKIHQTESGVEAQQDPGLPAAIAGLGVAHCEASQPRRQLR